MARARRGGGRRRHGALRRFVASSGCRCRCAGMTDGRHVVTLQRPPRAAAPDRDASGEFVAGVRYRAWQPPRACTRRSRSHAPLVFDLVDTWSGALARRLHVSRRASGRAQLRDVPGERERGRGAPGRALLRRSATRPGRDDAAAARHAIPSSRSRSTCAAHEPAARTCGRPSTRVATRSRLAYAPCRRTHGTRCSSAPGVPRAALGAAGRARSTSSGPAEMARRWDAARGG